MKTGPMHVIAHQPRKAASKQKCVIQVLLDLGQDYD